MYERTRHDRLTELETQLRWLREAGFIDVDCYYKWYNFAGLLAVKTAQRGHA